MRSFLNSSYDETPIDTLCNNNLTNKFISQKTTYLSQKKNNTANLALTYLLIRASKKMPSIT